MALPPSRLHRTDRLCQHGSARQLRCDGAAKLLSAVWQSRRLYLAPAELLSRRKRGRFLSGGPARARLSLLELPEVERESVWARARDVCFGAGCVVDLYAEWGHCGGASLPLERCLAAQGWAAKPRRSSSSYGACLAAKLRSSVCSWWLQTMSPPLRLLLQRSMDPQGSYRALRDAALRAR